MLSNIILFTFRMKVFGELPLLSVNISDFRLQEILALVQSIPQPEPGPPEPETDDIFKVGTWNLMYLSATLSPCGAVGCQINPFWWNTQDGRYFQGIEL